MYIVVCFSGVRVALSLVFGVVFSKSLSVLFSFGHCFICPSTYPCCVFKLVL